MDVKIGYAINAKRTEIFQYPHVHFQVKRLFHSHRCLNLRCVRHRGIEKILELRSLPPRAGGGSERHCGWERYTGTVSYRWW